MRILIVEGDREAAACLVKALREPGHTADCAHPCRSRARQAI
jgi:DNA-binding response OmpR family regulator